MFGLFKKKPELNYKSKAITIMYLSQLQNQLQKEIDSGKRINDDTIWSAKYDIERIQDTIKFLEEVR